MTEPAATGFTVADDDYFIGLVCMLASLRRQGHTFPVVVLDRGLTEPQRETLVGDFAASVVTCSEVAGWHASLLGSFPHLLAPTGIVVYLDADLVITRPFHDLVTAAANGMLCAVADTLGERRFPEWASALSLAGPLRHGTYVNLGFVVFATEHFPDLLRRWWACCAGLADTVSFPMAPSGPFAFADQDVLNALLMSEVPADAQLILPAHAQPMRGRELARTKLVDARTLACTFEGHPTAFLHPVGSPKPWQPQRRQNLYGSGYEASLRELIASRATSVRASGTLLSPWLEPGARGTWRWRQMARRTQLRRLRRRARRRLSRVVPRTLG